MCPERIHTDGLIEDVCNGELFQKHPLFSQDPYAIQVIAYYDEIELWDLMLKNINWE